MSARGRQRPLITGINGPLMVRGCLNVAVAIDGEFHDRLKKASLDEQRCSEPVPSGLVNKFVHITRLLACGRPRR
jgi:hypothetical protein